MIRCTYCWHMHFMTIIVSVTIIVIRISEHMARRSRPSSRSSERRSVRRETRGPPAFRRGRDRQGSHRGAANPLHFAVVCFKCAHVDTCCHILPHFLRKVDYGESRHFCDDPVCPDPRLEAVKGRGGGAGRARVATGILCRLTAETRTP